MSTIGAEVAHERALTLADAIVSRVGDDQWSLPTPCEEWNVRSLVNHMTGEARWTVPLLDGATIAEVGAGLDGDLLGSDPAKAWSEAQSHASAAAAADGVAGRVVHLSFGDTPGAEYLTQLAVDYLIHSWDLAVSIGADVTLPADLVEFAHDWFTPMESNYRAAGVIGPRPDGTDSAVGGDDGQARPAKQEDLLRMFGRSSGAARTAAAVARFGAAFDRQDIDAVMAAMTADCVFESTVPPDGRRYDGQSAVRAAFAEFFAASPTARFTTEEQVVCGDRAVVRWCYSWDDNNEHHVRGVDLFAVRDDLVAAKLAYVKG
jgi:uncharacterized protein (TIGR03086 family)